MKPENLNCGSREHTSRCLHLYAFSEKDFSGKNLEIELQKLKNLLHFEGNNHQCEEEPIKWDRFLANYISDKRMTSRICKELQNNKH